MKTRALKLAILLGLAACGCRPVAGPAPVASTAPAPSPGRVRPFPGVEVVHAPIPAVELAARVCIEAGWLEQIACAPGTREHEALVVVEAAPSRVHAALLMAGFLSGAPGRWQWDNNEVTFVAPTGSALDVLVRYERADGLLVEESVRHWIRDHEGRHEFPDDPWIFGGSRFETGLDGEEGPERYLADATGSIVGLVTFGDEVVGFSRVLPDQVEALPPEWEADVDRLPPVGTRVTLVLREAPGTPRRRP